MLDIFEDIRKLPFSEIEQGLKIFLKEDNIFNGDINYQNEDGESLLHFAAFYDYNVNVIKILVSMGANINTKTNYGWTPLHSALKTFSNENARVLIDLGADVNICNEDGLSSFDLALVNGKIEIIDACLNHKADINTINIKDSSPLNKALHEAVNKRIATTSDIYINVANFLISEYYIIYFFQKNDASSCEKRDLNFKEVIDFFYSIASEWKITEIQSIYSKFLEVLKNNPNDIKALNDRGFHFYHKEYYTLAIEDYNKIIQLDSDYIEAYRQRGISYYEINKNDKAIDDFNFILKINPGDAGIYRLRGKAYTRKFDYKKAIEDFKEAIRLDPDFPESYDEMVLNTLEEIGKDLKNSKKH